MGARTRLMFAPCHCTSSIQTEAARITRMIAGFTTMDTPAATATATEIPTESLDEAPKAIVNAAIDPAMDHPRGPSVRQAIGRGIRDVLDHVGGSYPPKFPHP
jgi:hypothetical protein